MTKPMAYPVLKKEPPASSIGQRQSTAPRGLRIAIQAFALTALASAAWAAPFPSPSNQPPVKKILFFDDGDILYRTGTKRQLHELQKTPHPGLITYSAYTASNGVEKERAYWESQIAWVTVYRKPDLPNGQPPEGPRYQMWYQGHTASKTSDRRKKSNVCYAYSQDGLKWIRPGRSPGAPGLGLYDFAFNVIRYADGTTETVTPPNPNDITQNSPDGSYQYFPASETNIVMIGSGGYGERFANSVLVEPNDPNPNRRYKMMFYDWANTTSGESLNDPSTFPNNVAKNTDPDPDGIGNGFQAAFSPDGINWTKFTNSNYIGYPGPAILSRTAFGGYGQPPTTAEHAANPLDYIDLSTETKINRRWNIPLTMADAVDLLYDPVRNKYVVYGKMWVQGPSGVMSWKHAMGRVESSDFFHWSAPELILTTGDKDADEIKFHTSPVFYYEGMYLSLNQIYHDPALLGLPDMKSEHLDIELMSSRDGIQWDRNYIGQPVLPRGAINPSIQPGQAGYYLEFDSAHIFTNSFPIVLEDEIRFYYGAYGNKSGIGLATIKRDRIVGIKATEVFGTGTSSYRAGQVTLRKINLSGTSTIAINGVAEPGGYIKVELLNKEGRPISGYTLADANSLTGDAASPYTGSVPSDPLNRKVSWGGSTALSNLSASEKAECSIRIYLKNAEVFSCSLVP